MSASRRPHTDRNQDELGEWLYHGLFEQVPFNVAIIDRDFTIIEANGNFADYFGNWKGKKCYKVFKNLEAPCLGCNAQLTFQDGRVRISDESGVDQHGTEAHYVVHHAPLRKKRKGAVDYIIAMTRDIVDMRRLQAEYQLLFERVPCYITVIDRNFKIIRANENFRETFGDVRGKQCYEVYKKRKTKCPNCPAAKSFKDGQVHHSNQIGVKRQGDEAHYMLTTAPLSRDVQNIPHVIEISTDITAIKKLEREVIEAERLAAVGQTVAGLAHSIKNILMGLEGGMYIVQRALKNNNTSMLDQGWSMLERNLTKTTSLVKDFLSFAKGRLPDLQLIDPKTLVDEIVELYCEIAREKGVKLVGDYHQDNGEFPLDPKGIHTCLTNLVSNAIDACQMCQRPDCTVTITVEVSRSALKFIISDNGSGMDYEIKQKLFTTFFTTKGGQGTGLGLLTTHKIIKEHGGYIRVDSQKGKGSKFTINLPRKRLLELYRAGRKENNDVEKK